ncbi:hypothetical protein [Prauserella sp. PE36]|uniref:WXG100-like domain-containing protein n=1 Tax=Prauserella sp. PE36 TaxID=1504709 RepID=UPI0018F66CB0|nr:hypothetical protein [Prauserella sp. PE36]
MAEEAGGTGGAPAPPAEEPPAEPAPAEQPPAEEPPAEQPPAEQPPAEEPPAEQPPAEQPPAEEPSAEQPPAETPPADAEPGEPAPDGGEADAAPGEAPGETDPGPPAAPGQQPAPGEQGRPAPQDGNQASGDELKDRVLAEAPLPETDPKALRAAADGLKQTGTQGQQAADEALKVAHAAGPDWRGRPGQQFGEQATAEAERTRAVGEEMTKLGDGLARGADTVDALRDGRLAEIEDGRPIFDLSRTMPPGEAAFAEERVVRDLVARGQAMTEQAKEQVRGAFEGWNVSPVQHEKPPQEIPHRLDIELGDKKGQLRGPAGEKLFGANKTGDQIDRSRLSDGQLERNYDAVRDASFKVDSGMRELEIAGKDVPAKFEAEVTGWHSTGLPQDGSLYTEWLDTPTPQAGRFEGKAAWGAGGSVATRTDVGDASARVRAEALAGGEAEASLDVGGRFFGAEAGAFAGAKANVSGFADYGGIGAGGKAEARVGIGLDGGFTAGKQGDKWVIGGKVGAALGIGGKLEGQIVIDPQKATQTLKDVGSAIAEGFRNPGPVSPYANYF